MPLSSIKRQVLTREPEPWGRLVKFLQQKAEKAETVSFATEGRAELSREKLTSRLLVNQWGMITHL